MPIVEIGERVVVAARHPLDGRAVGLGRRGVAELHQNGEEPHVIYVVPAGTDVGRIFWRYPEIYGCAG
jgi:hypothetical protein